MITLSFIEDGCLFCGSSLISNSCLMACAVQREDGCEAAHFAAFVARPLCSLERPVFPSWAQWRQCEYSFFDEKKYNSETFRNPFLFPAVDGLQD